MKVIINVVIILICILLIVNILFAIMLHGSACGTVSKETDASLLNTGLALFSFLALLLYAKYSTPRQGDE
jgi:membrane protein implicated in regulation of membrane protease activity